MLQGNKNIGVLDFGGQYAHLIASRVRRLGAYSELLRLDEIKTGEIPERFSGLIYSGGPSSVYENAAPQADPALLELGLPVLGICYGHQLMMKQLGADIASSDNREYGPAFLQIESAKGIFQGEDAAGRDQVWMSHGDEVHSLPSGFDLLASTEDCRFAAVGDLARNLYGLQFHPEVVDTVRGEAYLRNFIRLCALENSWTLENFLETELEKLKAQIGDKKVFFLISGGVDSTVAYALLAQAVPQDHLRGLLVDTGFMREGEIEEVREALRVAKVNLEVIDASGD